MDDQKEEDTFVSVKARFMHLDRISSLDMPRIICTADVMKATVFYIPHTVVRCDF
jgi:hypothetical protein